MNTFKFRLSRFILWLLISLLLYLFFYPTPITPGKWNPPLNKGFTGEYETNHKLANTKVYPTLKHIAPEDVAVDSLGRLYGGTLDGKIIRLQPDGSGLEILADTKGRPLGLHFDQTGNLIIADADIGLLSMSKDKKLTTLTVGPKNKPMKFADDLEIAKDGTIYFSDASDKYSVHNYKLDLLEHKGNGRLLSYHPENQETKVLLNDLYFANGVAISTDQQFLLINETAKYRIWKYWIDGPKKGTKEIFKDQLPGFPDGVSSNGEGIFWVAFTAPRNGLLDATLPIPFLRKIIARLPEAIKPKAEAYSFVVGFDESGNVVYNLQDPAGKFSQIASAQQFGNKLYLGSLAESGIGVYQLKPIDK